MLEALYAYSNLVYILPPAPPPPICEPLPPDKSIRLSLLTTLFTTSYTLPPDPPPPAANAVVAESDPLTNR
jgi:hypothetical protein